jgi:3D-(3,5/4)-trihydroxycyclohexane-1,2-dione acylhydrolase (decyclizing)
VITGQKVIVVVCDNGGFAVIDRLQTGMGGRSFNNMFDNTGEERVKVDWVAHARSLGCEAESVDSIGGLEEAFTRARGNDRTTVIAIETAPHEWTPGGAFWEVGVAEVSDRAEVAAAHDQVVDEKQRQRVGW